MIPIRDTQPAQNVAVANKALIAINTAVFLLQLAQGPEIQRFNYFYGLVPARYTVPRIGDYFSLGQQAVALVTFMFLHGGFWHILGNMWSLYIFGDNVEDRLGPLRYIVFYLACGFASGMTQLIFNPYSNVPTIGASGAIAGVMGAYFILYPRAKILTLIPILFFPLFFEIPAFVFIGIWFLLQVINAAGGAGGLAWWAHIGGFTAGVLLIKLSARLPKTGLSDRLAPLTTRRRTERLQVVRPDSVADDSHFYGTLAVTPGEAQQGTTKLVNVPWGLHKRLIRVTVPPGIKDGGSLRLKGLGRWTPEGLRGDLYLRVVYKG